LNEVVVGVQFDPIDGLQSRHYFDVYQLFAEDLPVVSEHAPLDPKYETFGTGLRNPALSVSLAPPVSHPRMWLASDVGDHLVQFQPDRLLLNWRKRNEDQQYPHFEGIVELYEAYLNKLSKYIKERFSSGIAVSQAEVSYINIVEIDDLRDAPSFFSCLGRVEDDLESITYSSSSVLSKNDKPVARYFREINSAFLKNSSRRALRASLTVRGSPGSGSDFLTAFFFEAREKIVLDFEAITTKKAHDLWRRK
jgi:uncharacterized protein (TIGR04255 family)